MAQNTTNRRTNTSGKTPAKSTAKTTKTTAASTAKTPAKASAKPAANTDKKRTGAQKAIGRHPGKRRTLSPVAVLLALLILLLLLIALFHVLFSSDTARSEEAASDSEMTESEYETETEPTATIPPSRLTAEYFGTENGYKTYQSDDMTAALGVDVSSFQGWIDWEQVADSGVSFAVIRAGFRGYTDGETNRDIYFTYNIESALANGLDVGIYFFSQALTPEEAEEEAETVLDMVAGYDITYPIYFDWESVDDADARTNIISRTELTACAEAFCSTIERAGYQAGIYFNLSQAARLYALFDLTDYAFWLAEYQDTPSFPYAIDMWQYTNEGTVPGIAVTVDLNLSFPASGQ